MCLTYKLSISNGKLPNDSRMLPGPYLGPQGIKVFQRVAEKVVGRRSAEVERSRRGKNVFILKYAPLRSAAVSGYPLPARPFSTGFQDLGRLPHPLMEGHVPAQLATIA